MAVMTMLTTVAKTWCPPSEDESNSEISTSILSAFCAKDISSMPPLSPNAFILVSWNLYTFIFGGLLCTRHIFPKRRLKTQWKEGNYRKRRKFTSVSIILNVDFFFFCFSLAAWPPLGHATGCGRFWRSIKIDWINSQVAMDSNVVLKRKSNISICTK